MSLDCLCIILIVFRVNTYDKYSGGFTAVNVMSSLIIEFLVYSTGRMILFPLLLFIEFLSLAAS